MFRLPTLLAGCVLLAMTAPAWAAWPDRPIKLVVPYAPGGSSDLIARKYGSYVQSVLDQPVVIENKPGASTNIGSEQVVRASPDGYTFLWGIDTLATNPSTGPVPSFDPQKDLEPVGLVTRIPGLVASNVDLDAGSLEELLAKAKANPGKYSISSASLFLQVALLQAHSGISLTHVPYKGGAQAAMDAVGGQVNLVFANIPVLKPLVASGKLHPVAVTSAERSKSLPDVPTLAEGGVHAEIANWYAVFAPKGTPAKIIERLNEITVGFVNDPKIRDELEPLGYLLESSSPEQLGALLRKDTAVTADFVRKNPKLARPN
ncbi:hypothetical protein AD428_00795 [Achromobacter sp. DMS1]|uniref:Bug family tripartite tricarboxylate transporter substrate binding protein n=1 Tax=Achromobacter sp. DMS1 TaxID=1688405 RepID=UPI00069E9127|nr:tripartite tricarboxylate transporter substrate binding protein [Achromobacter sp. DMS1]KOF55419.1 hypothetical protein AD428_00795 [Achromobacter sp. DMS1]